MHLRTLACLAFPLLLQAQSLALSFDDGMDPRTQPMAAEFNSKILESLSEAKIHSILLPAGKRVDSPEGLKLVRSWGEAGHLVGNHTYSHANLGAKSTRLEVFEQDVLRNEALLKGMPGWTKRFRFPYLKEGESKKKRDGFRTWMKRHHYQPAAVSIDASDWYYDMRYRDWEKDHPNADPEPFREAYVHHLLERAAYYEVLAQQTLHRSPAHVLLLHTNAINAAFLPDVIAAFQAKGWKFVDAAEAFKDPLYAMKPQVLPAGESILWALAKAQGMAGLRYPAEDGDYEAPLLDASLKRR